MTFTIKHSEIGNYIITIEKHWNSKGLPVYETQLNERINEYETRPLKWAVCGSLEFSNQTYYYYRKIAKDWGADNEI